MGARARECTWLSFGFPCATCVRVRVYGVSAVRGRGRVARRGVEKGEGHVTARRILRLFSWAVSQGDADASGLWEFGTCACLHTPYSWSAHEGEISSWCLEREGEKEGGRPDLRCPRHIGRHKARNPWEYRACASVRSRSCAARVMGWPGHPPFFPPFFFLSFSLSSPTPFLHPTILHPLSSSSSIYGIP